MKFSKKGDEPLRPIPPSPNPGTPIYKRFTKEVGRDSKSGNFSDKTTKSPIKDIKPPKRKD